MNYFLETVKNEYINYHIIDKGTIIADKISNRENSSNYFKEFTQYILGNELKAEGLVVCADGDFNRVNFAALPYQDGYVIDYCTVRNIGSVLDLVYPNERKPINNALLFNAPDYGGVEGSGWEYLFGSKIEQMILTNTLGEELDISVDCLYDKTASKAELKSRLVNKYGLLHISTHGTVIDGKVRIVAAGANNKNEDALISDIDMNDGSLDNTSVAIFALCFGARQLLSLQDSLSEFIKTAASWTCF